MGYGDLLESQAEVLVIPASTNLCMRGGLPREVWLIAGECVRTDAMKHASARLGDVVVTGAGTMLAKYLFQVVTVAKITAKTISQCLVRTNTPIKVEHYICDTYDIYTTLDYLPFFEWFAAYKHGFDYQTESLDNLSEELPVFADVEVADCAADNAARHRIFISYSRSDDEKARGVCDLLNKLGIPYWIDIKGIYSGRNFKEVIVKAISTAR